MTYIIQFDVYATIYTSMYNVRAEHYYDNICILNTVELYTRRIIIVLCCIGNDMIGEVPI